MFTSGIPELPDSGSPHQDHHQEGDPLRPQGPGVVPPLPDIPVDHEEGQQEDAEAEAEETPERDIHAKKTNLVNG